MDEYEGGDLQYGHDHLCSNCKKAIWYEEHEEYLCDANGCGLGQEKDLSEGGCSAYFEKK